MMIKWVFRMWNENELMDLQMWKRGAVKNEKLRSEKTKKGVKKINLENVNMNGKFLFEFFHFWRVKALNVNNWNLTTKNPPGRDLWDNFFILPLHLFIRSPSPWKHLFQASIHNSTSIILTKANFNDREIKFIDLDIKIQSQNSTRVLFTGKAIKIVFIS